MTDFSLAYTSEWHLYRVNPDTWADGPEVGRLVSASFTHDSEGDSPEIESGNMTVEGVANEAWEPGYYRVAMRAIQGGATERVDVATMLCGSDSGTLDRGRDQRNVIGYSVLHPAATTHVKAGDFAAAGQDGAQKAADMLSECIKAPVSVEGSFALSDHYNFEVGQPVLEAVWMLLRAGGYCMQVDGRGRVRVLPLPTIPALILDRANARAVLPQVGHSLDYADVPNRYTADDNGITATVENDDPASPTSHSVRGYWVDLYDDSPAMLQGESLQAYAARMLEEASVLKDARTYTRRWMPDVLPFDVVRGSMPSNMLDGDMRVVSQTLECSHGISVTETSAKEVAAWSR